MGEGLRVGVGGNDAHRLLMLAFDVDVVGDHNEGRAYHLGGWGAGSNVCGRLYDGN